MSVATANSDLEQQSLKAPTPSASSANADENAAPASYNDRFGSNNNNGNGNAGVEVNNADEHGTKSTKAFIVVFMLSIVLAVILRWGADSLLDSLPSNDSCNDIEACVGIHSIYRISFSLFLWFSCLALLTAVNARFHTDFWTIKVCLYLLILFLSFFMPADTFASYADLARILSFFFLLAQVVILVDMAYDLHEYLLTAEAGETDVTPQRKCTYLFISLACLVLGFVGVGLLFGFMSPAGCQSHDIFITVVLVAGVCCLLLSLSNVVGKGLLTPSVVFVYCVFLTWQGLWSDPDVECINTDIQQTGDDDEFSQVVVGLAFTVLSLGWTAFSAARKAPDVFRMDDQEEQVVATRAEASEERAKQARHWVFHIVMALASMYMSMVLTAWGDSNGLGRAANHDSSTQSMYVKLGCAWITYALYTWTLLGPVCCSGRDFSDTNNQFN
jgi:hypothetical protein